ncbi:aldo/keto reductase [Xenorhabdus sp. TH1]|uniref:aldo/keto reductase n=1 Tax=Xenorhabdus sp. TH1 TaxID=3130166 RepID=UPI0030CC785E
MNTCETNGIVFIAYSPISRGLLSAQYKTSADLGHNDFRRTLPRFSDEAIEKNYVIFKKIEEIARSVGITPTQLAISWVINRRENIITIPGIKTLKYLKENSAVNSMVLPKNIFESINDILSVYEIFGKRYSDTMLREYGL